MKWHAWGFLPVLCGVLLGYFVAGCCGCKEEIHPKQFLFDHPEISFSVGIKDFNRFTTNKVLEDTDFSNELVVFHIKGKDIEVLLNSEFQPIPGTKYEVKAWGSGALRFAEEDEPVSKVNNAGYLK